jgi:hypothetical protein
VVYVKVPDLLDARAPELPMVYLKKLKPSGRLRLILGVWTNAAAVGE